MFCNILFALDGAVLVQVAILIHEHLVLWQMNELTIFREIEWLLWNVWEVEFTTGRLYIAWTQTPSLTIRTCNTIPRVPRPKECFLLNHIPIVAHLLLEEADRKPRHLVFLSDFEFLNMFASSTLLLAWVDSIGWLRRPLWLFLGRSLFSRLYHLLHYQLWLYNLL